MKFELHYLLFYFAIFNFLFYGCSNKSSKGFSETVALSSKAPTEKQPRDTQCYQQHSIDWFNDYRLATEEALLKK
ncbi:MAG: hypothetical protein SFU25_10605, partial [Candidatus Caenarcaniphilales bacterium]|nr:hypothetical protein [Candidatus Caenarcaniphilales bacterium]